MNSLLKCNSELFNHFMTEDFNSRFYTFIATKPSKQKLECLITHFDDNAFHSDSG